MTHEERVWELYKLFAAVGLNAEFFGAFEEESKQKEFAERYHATAETFASTFERLSEEREGRMSSSQPFERRVPNFNVTAKEG